MHVFYGIAKTIMDGTKDADQQYDFAMQAKAEGKPEIAAKHIEEAKKRLAGVKEWYDIGVKLLASEKSEPLVDAVDAIMKAHDRETTERS